MARRKSRAEIESAIFDGFEKDARHCSDSADKQDYLRRIGQLRRKEPVTYRDREPVLIQELVDSVVRQK